MLSRAISRGVSRGLTRKAPRIMRILPSFDDSVSVVYNRSLVTLPAEFTGSIDQLPKDFSGKFVSRQPSKDTEYKTLKEYNELFLQERFKNYHYVELLKQMPVEFYQTLVKYFLQGYTKYYMFRSEADSETTNVISSKLIERHLNQAIKNTTNDTTLLEILNDKDRKHLQEVKQYWPNEINVPVADLLCKGFACFSAKGVSKVTKLEKGEKPYAVEFTATSLGETINLKNISSAQPTLENKQILRDILDKKRQAGKTNEETLRLYQNLLDKYELYHKLNTITIDLGKMRDTKTTHIEKKRQLLYLLEYIRRKSTMSHHFLQLTTPPAEDGSIRHMLLLIPFTDSRFDLPLDLDRYEETKTGYIVKTIGGTIRLNLKKGYMEYYVKFTDKDLQKYMICDFTHLTGEIFWQPDETSTPVLVSNLSPEDKVKLINYSTNILYNSPSVQKSLTNYILANDIKKSEVVSPTSVSSTSTVGGMPRRTRRNTRKNHSRRGGGLLNTIAMKTKSMFPIAAKKVTTAVSGAVPTAVRIPSRPMNVTARNIRGKMFAPTNSSYSRNNRRTMRRYGVGKYRPYETSPKNEQRFLNGY